MSFSIADLGPKIAQYLTGAGLTAEINAANLDTNATGVGFYGTTPVAKQAAVTAAVAITGGESPTEAEYNLLVTAINDLITKLENYGLLAAN
jgi:hypothetical protein